VLGGRTRHREHLAVDPLAADAGGVVRLFDEELLEADVPAPRKAHDELRIACEAWAGRT